MVDIANGDVGSVATNAAVISKLVQPWAGTSLKGNLPFFKVCVLWSDVGMSGQEEGMAINHVGKRR